MTAPKPSVPAPPMDRHSTATMDGDPKLMTTKASTPTTSATNPLTSGTFGLDFPFSPTLLASIDHQREYFPPFDSYTTANSHATSVPPIVHSQSSPLTDIVQNSDNNKQNNINDANTSDDKPSNDNDRNERNDHNTGNSNSFPVKKERHTFGYDDDLDFDPASFMTALPPSPVGLSSSTMPISADESSSNVDYDRVHPLDLPATSTTSSVPAPSLIIATVIPAQSMTSLPSSPLPAVLPKAQRPVVSPSFVHDLHLASETELELSKPSSANNHYRNSIIHKSSALRVEIYAPSDTHTHAHVHHHPPHHHAGNNNSAPMSTRVTSACSCCSHSNRSSIEPNRHPPQQQTNDAASDKQKYVIFPKSKSALPKQRRFSFFSSFSNTTAPMDVHTHSPVITT
ncbi:hypothetical protein BG004_002423, partial [Podila humilis]